MTGDFALKGFSSMWSFITYGLGTFLVAEGIHNYLYNAPLLLRCVLYVPGTYAAEFTFGLILTFFNACPWDYTEFEYDLMGLITLEYAPAWFMAGVYFEYIMSVMERLEEVPRWKLKQS